jgi:hypothetical protein
VAIGGGWNGGTVPTWDRRSWDWLARRCPSGICGTENVGIILAPRPTSGNIRVRTRKGYVEDFGGNAGFTDVSLHVQYWVCCSFTSFEDVTSILSDRFVLF